MKNYWSFKKESKNKGKGKKKKEDSNEGCVDLTYDDDDMLHVEDHGLANVVDSA